MCVAFCFYAFGVVWFAVLAVFSAYLSVVCLVMCCSVLFGCCCLAFCFLLFVCLLRVCDPALFLLCGVCYVLLVLIVLVA